MTYRYRVHGLRLDSDLEIGDLLVATDEGEADIVFKLGATPKELDQPFTMAEGFQVGGGQVLLDIEKVARFWVRDAKTLIVEPVKDADPGALRLFLLGSGLAALLHQRGEVPLHACAIEYDGGCVAFIGDSGAGKSTLAALLGKRGFPIVSDDVLVLRPDGDGPVLTQPSVPVLKLWPESLPHSDFAGSDAPFEFVGYNKHRIRASEKFVDKRIPLTRIYVLSWQEPAAEAAAFRPLSPFEAMISIRKNVYRPWLAAAVGGEPAFIRLSARLLAEAKVFVFQRAKSFEQVPAQLEALSRHLRHP